MVTNRKPTIEKLIAACLTLAACNTLVVPAWAGPVLNPDQSPHVHRSELLLAQLRGRLTGPGPTGPGPTGPGPTGPGPTRPGPTLPGPTLPGPTDPGPSGESEPKHQVRVIPACVVTTTSGSASSDCSTRFINYRTLYSDVYSCTTGRCYATKFLEIAKTPMIVVYPQVSEARAAAQAELQAEMVAGVRTMGSLLRERVNNGDSGLPSLAGIDDLVRRAIDEIDRINQPVDESMDERLRRLGLGPAARSLARTVQDS